MYRVEIMKLEKSLKELKEFLELNLEHEDWYNCHEAINDIAEVTKELNELRIKDYDYYHNL
ncbi:MAG: hypothetical protein ACRC0V_05995 [Fusobacteriaceae bacterium]